ncbi:MAG: tRNA (5-methylaminomethyl-2-thiouridine)(34)-methyltransferase MnmD [Bacteroidales bacterium]|nr:tRNA (5-methylaminomethyl-2-thiouridine)(34)-methyltransferase MnmD [Bacteroidales bacterium]
MLKKIIKTEDGSHTIFIPELNEYYHSKFGAIQESDHIFINAGFKFLPDTLNTVNILEIGFGTGLNSMLTFFEAKKRRAKIYYVAIEPFPIQQEIYSLLNYHEFIKNRIANSVFLKMHESKWNIPINISDNFILKKINTKIENIILNEDKYKLVYFDAFAPDVQPELWTEQIFSKIYKAMNKDGVLLTFSAKGEIKRRFKKIGFTIENLPGPVGKREITRARKIP